MDWLGWALLCASALLILFVLAWMSIVKIDPRKPSCVALFQSTGAAEWTALLTKTNSFAYLAL